MATDNLPASAALESAFPAMRPRKSDRTPRSKGRTTAIVAAWRVGIIAAFLAGWQWLPQVSALRQHIRFMDPFFVSSPSLVAENLVDLCTGRDDTATIWPFLWYTVRNALIGIAIATVIGTALALILSNSAMAERILRPIIVVLNAVPRIAIIPIMVLIAGTSAGASITTCVTVVVFLIFFNALEAGRGTPEAMIHAAQVSGAPPRDVMLRVRMPYVLAWVAASMPNAVAFGLVGSVTVEVFVGGNGVGQLLINALNTANATLTFSVVVVLGAVGAAMVLGVDYLRHRLMPWWT